MTLAHTESDEALRVTVAPRSLLPESSWSLEFVSSLLPEDTVLGFLEKERTIEFLLRLPFANENVRAWERLMDAPVVPIEDSPLSGRTMREAVGHAGVIASYAVFQGDPLVLLVVAPAAIVVLSAASGLAKALHDGIRFRLLRRMGVPLKGEIDIGDAGRPDAPPTAN